MNAPSFGLRASSVFVAGVCVTAGLAQLGPRHIITHLDQGVAGACIVLDADGDGDDDLVNSTQPLCRIYLNDGTGGFDQQHVLFDSAMTYVQFAAEANGDGRTDLFIRQGSSYTYALSDGAGNFIPVPSPYSDSNTLLCAAMDHDGDGISDAVCARPVDDDFILLTNDGSGQVGSPSMLVSGSADAELASAGDIDDDGDQDVLAQFGNGLWLMVNLGFGSFAQINMNTGVPRQTAIADMDQDGLDDLVISNGLGFGAGTLVIKYSTGGGFFDPADTVDIAFDPEATFRVEDIDGDGFPDLLFGQGDTLKWYRNDGAGALLPATAILPGFNPAYWKVSEQWTIDRDNDGDHDILARVRDYEHACVIDQLSPGVFDQVPRWLIGAWAMIGAEASDLDGDLDPDLVTFGGNGGSWSNQVINFFRNDGTENFAPRVMLADSNTNVMDLAIADLDVDGDLDVAYPSWGVQVVYWLENDGTGHFAQKQVCVSGGLQPYTIDLTDLTGDGAPDLLVTYWSEDTLNLFINDGSGQFGSPQNLYSPLNWPDVAQGADIDGDGDNDVVIGDGNFGANNRVYWLENAGGGNFPGSLIPVSQPSEVSNLLAIDDVDNDGDTDVIYNHQDGNNDTDVRLALNNGSGAFTLSTLCTIADELSDLRQVDMTGDGLPDVLIAERDEPFTHLQINLGGGNFAPPIILTDQQQWPVAALGADIDQDGLNDLVTASNGDRQLAWHGNPGLATAIGSATVGSMIVYPNPVGDHFVIESEEPFDAIEIVDLHGHILRTLLGAGTSDVLIERGALRPGMYMVRVMRDGTQLGAARVVVE